MQEKPTAPRTDAGAHPAERPAEPGERCTCGRRATVVFLDGPHGPTGWCGIPDGGDQTGPCPFCGAPRSAHPFRCPDYQLRPATHAAP